MAAMQGPERSQLLGLSAMLNVCQGHLDTLGPEFRPAGQRLPADAPPMPATSG